MGPPFVKPCVNDARYVYEPFTTDCSPLAIGVTAAVMKEGAKATGRDNSTWIVKNKCWVRSTNSVKLDRCPSFNLVHKKKCLAIVRQNDEV